ncbi:MAG: hypothetical protein BWY64_02789 [bacterium ADurb.Bin363]|nr:MAG: hypothetical protein BWY64_02789 [bacterium ADurb.Bin363]
MNKYNYFAVISIIMIFSIISPLAAQIEEPVSLKGIIAKIDSNEIIIKVDEKEILFSILEDTIFIRDNLLSSAEEFFPGNRVYCFYNTFDTSKKLLALMDIKSGFAISDGSFSDVLPELEKIFYGEKQTVFGTVKEVIKKDRIVSILTESGIEDLYIMKDILFFSHGDKFQKTDFSWESLKKDMPLEAIGYYKKDQILRVFYIEVGKSDVLPVEREIGTFGGVISSLDSKNQIIEVKVSPHEKLSFAITSDTIIFDWECGEKLSFKDLSEGQEVRVESIVSLNNTGEAIILEVGDSDLYY